MELIVLKKEDIAREIAKEIVTLINRKNNACLGLATGSSPIGVYQELIKAYNNKFVSFKNVKTYNKNLFEHIDINKENIHIPDGLNSSKCIGTYEQEIAKDGGIDFQILGIGSNGHIAFNEPGTSFSSHIHVVKLKESTIKDNSRFFESIDDVPTSAISMGLQSIMNAKRIVLIATGLNKAEAIFRLFTEDENENLPASILKSHPNCTIYADEEAASKLKIGV